MLKLQQEWARISSLMKRSRNTSQVRDMHMGVVKHSILWKKKEAFNVFTHQALTTCTEVDWSWTITSSQPRTKQERGGRASYGHIYPRGSRASGRARSGGIPVANVEGAASSTISTRATEVLRSLNRVPINNTLIIPWRHSKRVGDDGSSLVPK